MSYPSYILTYVDSPERSARFYAKLLDLQPVEASPTFALFVLPSGLKLGFWARDTVEPAAEASTVARNELAFAVENDDALVEWHADWTRKGMTIVQPPTRMDFGFTFVGLDPDGHRLRVFSPGEHE
jgi:predicted enzyme related to lactoylglutathione lyase